jgi:Ca-activated chloride channel family protein
VTALYEIIPTGIEPDVAIGGVDSLRYQRPARGRTNASGEMMFVKLRYKQPDGDTSRLLTHPVHGITRSPSTDFRFVTAVAGFGMLLRDSEHVGGWTLADVLESAQSGKGNDLEGYRAEFIDLVETVIRGEMVAVR